METGSDMIAGQGMCHSGSAQELPILAAHLAARN